MNSIISKEERTIVGTSCIPAVSIILPFEPKMVPKSEVELRLKVSLQKVERELFSNYASDKAIPVIQKLHRIIKGLNYNTHKQSIAIFASPMIEKVFYLDIAVEERIVIDESFEIRDLVYSKKQHIQYLILLLSAGSSKMYLGNCTKFLLIKSNLPDNVHAYEKDMPERVGNFSDAHKQHEIDLDSFLHHMDEGLSLMVQAYQLSVFVMGTERIIGHFRKITKNDNQIVQYIHGNYEKATESELEIAMKPYTTEWKKVKQQAVLQKIDQAMSEKKLAAGVKEVWDATSHKNGRLLIVEKDFMFPAHLGRHTDTIYKEDRNLHNPFYIKDAVDDIMEKILANGGDVEFVDNGALHEYGKIALIRFY